MTSPAPDRDAPACALLFLGAALELPDPDASADERARQALDETRRLARALVTPVDRSTWPHPWTAGRSAASRLARAQLLLYDAERHERSQSKRTADAWPIVDAEWAWASTDTFVNQWLVAHARTLGLDSPNERAAAVQAAIAVELVPLMHLKWLLASPDRAELHRRYLRQWKLPAGTSTHIIALYGWYLLALLQAGEEPSAVVDSNMVQIAREQGRDVAEVRSVLSYYATLRRRVANQQIEKKLPAASFARGLNAVDEVIRAGGGSLAMLELLSLLHLVTGVRQSTERLGESAKHFANAIVFDPLNGTAREQLDAVFAAPESLRKQADELKKRGTLRPGAYQTIANIERGIREAHALLDGPNAEAILQHRASLTLPTLAWRLLLDPGDPAELDRLAALCGAMDDVARSNPALGDYPLLVRARATERAPASKDLPWDRIIPVLEHGVIPAGFLLPLVLAEPAPPELASIALPVTTAALRADLAPALPQPRRRWWFDEWVISPRDRAYKAAAAAGIVMALYVAGAQTAHAVESRMNARAYERVATAANAADDARTVDAALEYLDGRDVADADPRAARVAGWLEDAMMRRVLTLVEAKRVDDAKTLLERFERVRPARIDPERTPDAR
jgi:hypothetical protein